MSFSSFIGLCRQRQFFNSSVGFSSVPADNVLGADEADYYGLFLIETTV